MSFRMITRLVLLALAAWVLWWGYGKLFGGGGDAAGGMPQMPPTIVETTRVAVPPLQTSLESVGTLRADESVVVRPEVAGRLERIHFKEGQRVNAGDLLFSLDGSLARSDLNEAEANLQNSKQAFERAQELIAKNLISKSDFDNRRAEFGVDEARVASARARLAKVSVRAPFGGVTGLREISVGEYVTAGQALVSLVRLDPMEVDFNLPENQLAYIAVGQSVVVSLDAFAGEEFSGKVLVIDPMIDQVSRTARLRASIANPQRKLRPGLFARVSLGVSISDESLMIPEQAIWPMGDQNFVYRVEEGVAKLIPVSLGQRLPGRVQVTSGLSAGDEIVTAGQLKIQDGAKVQVLPPAEAASE